jgi:hypothetical protein
MADTSREALDQQVYVGDGYKAFGDLTASDAEQMADATSGHSGGGLERHTVPISTAWRELARLLDEPGVQRVADLPVEQVRDFAERARVIPPGGSWLK